MITDINIIQIYILEFSGNFTSDFMQKNLNLN